MRKGYKFSEQTRINIANAKLAEKNPLWKGDKAGKQAIHIWIRKRLLKPDLCERCKTRKPIDLSNNSGKYLRVLTDWEYLCRKCHFIKDKKLHNNFLNSNKNHKFTEELKQEIISFRDKFSEKETIEKFNISKNYLWKIRKLRKL